MFGGQLHSPLCWRASLGSPGLPPAARGRFLRREVLVPVGPVCPTRFSRDLVLTDFLQVAPCAQAQVPGVYPGRGEGVSPSFLDSWFGV